MGCIILTHPINSLYTWLVPPVNGQLYDTERSHVFAVFNWQVGPEGAGHFVKMVHNGIEYGDMQLICEAYQLMKQALGMSNDEIGDVRHISYLLVVTLAALLTYNVDSSLANRQSQLAVVKKCGKSICETLETEIWNCQTKSWCLRFNFSFMRISSSMSCAESIRDVGKQSVHSWHNHRNGTYQWDNIPEFCTCLWSLSYIHVCLLFQNFFARCLHI